MTLSDSIFIDNYDYNYCVFCCFFDRHFGQGYMVGYIGILYKVFEVILKKSIFWRRHRQAAEAKKKSVKMMAIKF